MYRRRLLGLAVSLAALATTAAPAAAAPVAPDTQPDNIIAALIGTQGVTSRPGPRLPAGISGLLQAPSGMDSETEFMDYTDDALLDSAATTGLKFETEVTA